MRTGICVIPAEAGIQGFPADALRASVLGPRLRGDDGEGVPS
jgi:hypothetical protein